MIEIPTVFILGAGASKDFGFPLGRELFEEIRDELKENKSSLWKNLKKFRFDDDKKIKNFRNKLRGSDALSVDAFLETHDNFLDLGRMAIWLKIQSYEKDSMLLDRKGIHWYNYLFEEMHTASFEDFKQNQLSIVTFNYDRSLEHYFINKLMNRWEERKLKKCKEMLSNISIIHVYGKLAPLSWEDEPGIPYDFDVSNLDSSEDGYHTHLYINEAYKQIKIMKDKEIQSAEFNKAMVKLERAQRIFFLGFGYHEMNLNRLNLNEVSLINKSGTAYNLDKTKIDRIKELGIKIPDNKYDILNFLKNEASLSRKN